MPQHIDYEKEAEYRTWWLNNTGGTAAEGLTVRDYFAAKVMAAFAVKEIVSSNPEAYATRSYELADAMMKERAK